MHGPATGAENMAIDEAIGEAVASGRVPATLRFYAWSPPCISLGRNQPIDGVDLRRIAARGYQVVRRPTGGRAILHTDELTYSIAASPTDPLMSGLVLDSYLRISRGLVDGLKRLGIPAVEAPGTNRAGPDVSAACFEVPSAYEITAGGKKVLGSAQMRRRHTVIQHGSLPLTGDLTRVVDCLAYQDEAERDALRESLAAHAATAEAVLGRTVSLREAADALAAGLAEALGVAFAPGELDAEEIRMAEALVAEKYATSTWTARI